jgi:mono/diheme cytochrome c family protein
VLQDPAARERRMTVRNLLGASLMLLAAISGLAWPGTSSVDAQEQVDYATQVRPILSEYCYECHGPDDDRREADLRLDQKDQAFADLGGYVNIVPFKPDDSELYLRISADFAEERMPPYDAGTELTDEEIETIRAWIEQGAEWVGE